MRRSLLEVVVDRIIAGQPVTLYELGDRCRFPNHAGTYSYRTLGCKCRRCRAAHAEAVGVSVAHARARELARSMRRHPSNWRRP